MAKPEKRKAATVLLTMDGPKFLRTLGELNELHGAADEAAMAVASGYKGLKKQGVNLEALKQIRRLQHLGNPAKVAAFLADFDKMRELSGLDAQLSLFEEDKTKPQKDGESAKVVPIKPVAAAEAPAAETAAKPKKAAKAKAAEPVTKKALFDTGAGDGASDVEEVSDEVKARQAGMMAGAAGEDYENPFQSGPLRDAWHSGYVSGSESASAAEPTERASA